MALPAGIRDPPRRAGDAPLQLGLVPRATATSSVCANSRPIVAPICATSLAGPSRSSRAIRGACRLAGTASVGGRTSSTSSARSAAPPRATSRSLLRRRPPARSSAGRGLGAPLREDGDEAREEEVERDPGREQQQDAEAHPPGEPCADGPPAQDARSIADRMPHAQGVCACPPGRCAPPGSRPRGVMRSRISA